MITPTRFEVSCVAYDCDPDRYPHAPVVSKPLVIDARSVQEAGKKAHAAGWRRALSRGQWWCPHHAAVVAKADRQRTSDRSVTVPQFTSQSTPAAG